MGNVKADLNQSFWVAFSSVVREIVWEQSLSVIIVVAILMLIDYGVGKKFSLTKIVSVSMFSSFFLWPHLNLLYLHVTNPENFPQATFFHDFFRDRPIIGGLFGIIIILPLLLNQFSILLVLFVWPLASFCKSLRSHVRWLGYVGFGTLLPLAWFLDCFNEPPK